MSMQKSEEQYMGRQERILYTWNLSNATRMNQVMRTKKGNVEANNTLTNGSLASNFKLINK